MSRRLRPDPESGPYVIPRCASLHSCSATGRGARSEERSGAARVSCRPQERDLRDAGERTGVTASASWREACFSERFWISICGQSSGGDRMPPLALGRPATLLRRRVLVRSYGD
jgi:hypothetical protein